MLQKNGSQIYGEIWNKLNAVWNKRDFAKEIKIIRVIFCELMRFNPFETRSQLVTRQTYWQKFNSYSPNPFK